MKKGFILHYDKEAPIFPSEHKPNVPNGSTDVDEAWEKWSLPIGNGYFGANIFGRCETERIQITEKTLFNPHQVNKDGVAYTVGGMNSFSETFIDFGHTSVSDYTRYLDLESAIAGVEYTSGGVRYTRECFVSYPDKALIIRLDAHTAGALSFTLRPTIPYKQSYGGFVGDEVTKTGEVVSFRDNGIGRIELSANMAFYGIDMLGIYKVYTNGGSVRASTVEHSYRDTDGAIVTDNDGVIEVQGATSAYIIATLGTDYELSSDIFTSPEINKPTKKTTLADARAKVEGYMSAIELKIAGKSYEDAYKALRETHVNDYSKLFGRVSLELGFDESDFALTTDSLLEKYKSGKRSTYLEALFFQYGRYLLISSSREGTLPANLQGVWNTYREPAWACDYTHNINVQMNYWPAFPTNLSETFKAYVGYNKAYMKQAEIYADELIREKNPDAYGKDGGNGWVLGDHNTPYKYTSHKSAGNLGFMTQVFWEYYAFTKDSEVLKLVFDILVSAARYITKCVVLDENGHYMVTDCDSPEMYVDGAWYYTNGTTYAQSFAYLNNYNALEAARDMGIDLSDKELLAKEEYSILNTVMEQLDKYDPIKVGLSGQIKEFKEEDFYCSIGDDPHHRHTSQLVGLYPGNLINGTTPAWLDAAAVTLNERGEYGTGWGIAFKFNLWARVKDGNRAYKHFQTLLKEKTATNLWDIHPPFQIDGNFGGTAGVAEMLLQSHEGCIAPLAAIPDEWQNGSYQGLVARGNFEIGAEWENGLAKSFSITSNADEVARIYYPSISLATVLEDGGKKIEFIEDSKDIISFKTERGRSYTVSGFKTVTVLEKPKGLKISDAEDESLKLSWCAVDGAASYNVYKAVESAPVYTLIASANDTSLNYEMPASEINRRVTFAVTAISSDGYESERALCYKNPGIDTKYGFIPYGRVDSPFALFEQHGNEYSYIESFNNYSELLREIGTKSEFGRKPFCAVIYVTKNSEIRGASKESIQKLGCESITVDLGTRTIVLKDTLLELDACEASPLRLEFCNGRIHTDSGSVIKIRSTCDKIVSGEVYKITFDGITFGRERYSENTVPLFISDAESENRGVSFDIELNDCTVDYISAVETKPETLFAFSGGCDSSKINVVIRGGAVKLRSLKRLKLFEGVRDGRIIFARNKSGKRTFFKLVDPDYPDIAFTTEKGDKNLILTERVKVHYTIYSHYIIEDPIL